jgi:hypothetical protein
VTRKATRATQATVDSLHRAVAKSLLLEVKRSHRSKEPVSAALLSAAVNFLKLTETAKPADPKKGGKVTTSVGGDMPDFTSDTPVTGG